MFYKACYAPNVGEDNEVMWVMRL